MPFAVYILALCSFVVGTQSYAFVGLLAELANDLGVSVSTAGQLSAAFAITTAIASPLVAAALATFDRKRVLIAALLGVGSINLGTALIPAFEGILAARILVAVVGVAILPMAGALAASVSPQEHQGKALGIVLSGLTVAFFAGVPIGTFVGTAFGWRATFVFSGVVAVLATIPLSLFVPSVAMAGGRPKADWSVLKAFNVQVALLLMCLSFVAAYPVIVFLGPMITASTGIVGNGIGFLQSAIGFGTVFGLIAGSYLADARSFSASMRLLFGALTTAMAIWALVFIIGVPGTVATTALVSFAILLLAATLMAPSPPIQRALVTANPEQSSLTLAVNASMISLGQGLGVALGGAAISLGGYGFIGIFGVIVASIGLTLSFVLKKLPEPAPARATN